MHLKEENGLRWLEFDHLSEYPELTHGVFLRGGGVSQGPFASLNFSLQPGENPAHVSQNRDRALRALGLNRAFSSLQHHSKEVVFVEGTEPLSPRCDALTTQALGLGLLMQHADCQVALFYDPIHRSLAAAHSGWRGSVQNIYKATIEKMRERFGTDPSDLLVGISPSLGPEAAEFKNYQSELPPHFWSFQIKPTYFDFWEISKMQLIEAGVLAHHVEIARLCTHAHPADFFSYRRDKVTGRNASLIALR